MNEPVAFAYKQDALGMHVYNANFLREIVHRGSLIPFVDEAYWANDSVYWPDKSVWYVPKPDDATKIVEIVSRL